MADHEIATLEEIDAGDCWDLLRARGVGRLGICYGVAPDIFPVNYVVDGQTIVFRTEPGTKLAGATLMPAVAFEVDDVDEANRVAWSVVAHGRAVELETLGELMEAEALPLEPWAPGAKRHWVRIEVTNLTGRRIVKQG